MSSRDIRNEQESESRRLAEVARVFFRLGCIGFGGPAVHIAMMEEELVSRRKWLSRQHFLDLVGATNLIPGPNSTELTMHLGYERAGRKGLFVAGACFILPAVVITGIFAFLYQQYGQLPAVQPFIYGIKPAILSVLVSLMIGLGRKAVKSWWLGILGALAAAAVLLGANEIYVLFGAGFLGILHYAFRNSGKSISGFFPILLLYQPSVSKASAASLFFTFLKIGAILYGSGYVLFAFLDAELVSKGLLNKQELADAIAVGQFTPGPVFSSATFIGWQIAGIPGAGAATVGIFLPSFLFVALLNPIIPKLRSSKVFSAFLDSVNVASIAIILSVVVEIGRTAASDWRSLLIAFVSFAVASNFKRLNTAFVIFGGALLGFLLTLV